jgi:hypothetical protein
MTRKGMITQDIKNIDILLRKWELERLNGIHKSKGFLNNHPAVENLIDALLKFYDAYEETDGIRLDGKLGYNSKMVVPRDLPEEINDLFYKERSKELA